MENLASVYYYIALISTGLFVLKLIIFTVFGGDTEIETDFNDSVETETSFNFLSIQSILAFLMGLGWAGLACLLQFNMNSSLAIVISIVFGLLMMWFSAWLMLCIKKLNHTVKKDFSKCVGLSARAYTKFAPHSKGQIEITFNEQLSIEEAINNSDKEINSFSNVKVVKYENGILYIEQE